MSRNNDSIEREPDEHPEIDVPPEPEPLPDGEPLPAPIEEPPDQPDLDPIDEHSDDRPIQIVSAFELAQLRQCLQWG